MASVCLCVRRDRLAANWFIDMSAIASDCIWATKEKEEEEVWDYKKEQNEEEEEEEEEEGGDDKGEDDAVT